MCYSHMLLLPFRCSPSAAAAAADAYDALGWCLAEQRVQRQVQRTSAWRAARQQAANGVGKGSGVGLVHCWLAAYVGVTRGEHGGGLQPCITCMVCGAFVRVQTQHSTTTEAWGNHCAHSCEPVVPLGSRQDARFDSWVPRSSFFSVATQLLNVQLFVCAELVAGVLLHCVSLYVCCC